MLLPSVKRTLTSISPPQNMSNEARRNMTNEEKSTKNIVKRMELEHSRMPEETEHAGGYKKMSQDINVVCSCLRYMDKPATSSHDLQLPFHSGRLSPRGP